MSQDFGPALVHIKIELNERESKDALRSRDTRLWKRIVELEEAEFEQNYSTDERLGMFEWIYYRMYQPQVRRPWPIDEAQ